MQMKLIRATKRKPVETLYVVRNFKKVIEARDINHMTKELYEFLHLHCGFIAHFNLNGFKATYTSPKDFAEVFIRHFDREHRYFDGAYRCHEVQYKHTGYTEAEIKRKFFHIVDQYKTAISKWAEKKQRAARYAIYLTLKNEFKGGEARVE